MVLTLVLMRSYEGTKMVVSCLDFLQKTGFVENMEDHLVACDESRRQDGPPMQSNRLLQIRNCLLLKRSQACIPDPLVQIVDLEYGGGFRI